MPNAFHARTIPFFYIYNIEKLSYSFHGIVIFLILASIKGNIVLNVVNTVTGILFPVVTFPYAARVLLPEGIGAINFLNSIIGYIVLLTSLGIPLYAVKEVAKYRDNKVERNKITIEIIILNVALCILGYVVVWILAKYVPQIHKQASLFYILSLTIVFTAIGVNWFYQGIEDFKFITIRAIAIRTIAAISLFIFVKNSSDLFVYGIITVGTTVGNNFINFIHLHKHINIASIKIKYLNIGRHIKPTFATFILNLITSIYIHLNLIMLGFMTDDDQVGFFTAGTRITYIGITLISSIGTVLLPRCSHLLKVGDSVGFSNVINKSLSLTLALSFPMSIGLMILAYPITLVFCGAEFMSSIPVLRLNAPVVIFISLTNLIGIQILYPMDKVKIVILSVSGGAIINLLLNFVLIPAYGATGAAISTLIAEFTVFMIQIIYGRSYLPFKIKSIIRPVYIVSSVIMSLVVYYSTLLFDTDWIKVFAGILIGIAIYGILLACFKDSTILEFFMMIKKRFDHGKQ